MTKASTDTLVISSRTRVPVSIPAPHAILHVTRSSYEKAFCLSVRPSLKRVICRVAPDIISGPALVEIRPYFHIRPYSVPAGYVAGYEAGFDHTSASLSNYTEKLIFLKYNASLIS